MADLLPQIRHWLRTGRVAAGKIINLHIPELYSIVRGKVGKAVEFGVSWGITRLRGGFVLATMARDREDLHDSSFAVRAVEDLAATRWLAAVVSTRRFQFQETTGLWHAGRMKGASHTTSFSADTPDVVKRYVSLRKTQVHINAQLVSRLARPTLVAAAKRLGIWHKGELIVSSMGVGDLLTDVCLYDCFPGGKSPISRYQAVAAPVTQTKEALVLEAMARLPSVSLYRIQRRRPGIGVETHDLLTDEDVLIMDRGLGETAKVGLCLATRLIRFPDVGITMTSGASMVVAAILAQDLADDIHAELGPGAQACLARMGTRERSRYAIRMLREILAELSFGDLVSEVRTKDVE